MSAEGAQVFVGGTEAAVTLREATTLRFRVPNDLDRHHPGRFEVAQHSLSFTW